MGRVEDCATASKRQEHQDTREKAVKVLGSVILTQVCILLILTQLLANF